MIMSMKGNIQLICNETYDNVYARGHIIIVYMRETCTWKQDNVA